MKSKWPILTMVVILWFKMASIENMLLDISVFSSYRILFVMSNPHLLGHGVQFYYYNWIYYMIIFVLKLGIKKNGDNKIVSG